MSDSDLKSLAPCTALRRFWGAQGRCTVDPKRGYGHGKALGLQLGGALAPCDASSLVYSMVPTGRRGGSDDSGDLSGLYNEDPLDYASSPKPLGDDWSKYATRQKCGSARAKSCRSRALHPKWCATTSGPSVECVWVMGPSSSVPVGLGVTVAQILHRQLSAGLPRPHCTACSGREMHADLQESWPPGPPRGP